MTTTLSLLSVLSYVLEGCLLIWIWRNHRKMGYR